MKIQAGNYMLLTILACLLGYGLTFLTITKNLVHNPDIPDSIRVLTTNTDSKTIKYFSYKVSKSDMVIEVQKNKFKSDPNDIFFDQTLFHRNPDFMIWTFLICSMTSFSVGIFIFFIGRAKFINSYFKLENDEILIALFGVVVYLFFLWHNADLQNGFVIINTLVDKYGVLISPSGLIYVFVGLAMVFSCPIVYTLISICQSFKIPEKVKSIDFPEVSKNYIMLNKELNYCLQYLAIFVVLAVLTSSYLRLSFLSTISLVGFDLFPLKAVYVYGLFFSFLLFLFYVPIFQYLKFGLEHMKNKALEEKTTEQKELINKTFQESIITNSPFENLKIALTVLAPFISSALPDAIKLF